MTRRMIAGGAFATVLVVLALAAGRRAREQQVHPATPTSPAAPAEAGQQGFLYGRITTSGGDTYEGRLRWGGDQEAFWGDYFNGAKDENPWVATWRSIGCPGSAARSRSSGSKPRRTGDRQGSISAGSSWRASATSRASSTRGGTCG